MDNVAKLLLNKYFEENSIVKSNIDSFNNFIEKELQNIIDENKEIIPTIIPQNAESFKIKLEKIWILKPEIIEADGARREILPNEARLRKLSYAAPVFIEVSSNINDIQRENFQTQVGSMPIMIKSNYCHLSKMNREDLIKNGEDPDDPGGYFIINGTERVLVSVEDISPNKFLITEESTGPSPYSGKIFSEYGAYKIPHSLERLKDGIFYLSFTRVKRVSLILVLKSLGMIKDEEIMKAVSGEKQYDELLVNLYEYVDVKKSEDAMDLLAKEVGITQTKEIRLQRAGELIDKYLLPHLGVEETDRLYKAHNLCKMLKKYIQVLRKERDTDDKDHYMNKRLKLSGDLLGDLVRVNLKVLIGDMLYNFQRIVKRGKFPSIKIIIREKLLTSRIYSSMATGNWVGGRKGISQRVQRLNFLNALSHLQRVVSPLSSTQENFKARELHATHQGRLCPSETPEGTNIGLRKNLALLASITKDANESDVVNFLKTIGLKEIEQ